MVIPKWSFLILFVFTVSSASASDDVTTEIMKEITQANAETILRAQNVLREYLIHLFTNIRYGTLHFDGYNTIIENVIKGLQKRDLDPLKVIKNREFYQYNTQRPPFREIAKVIYNMQGCDEANDFSISRWESVLEIIPHLSDRTTPVPKTDLGTPEFGIIDKLDRPLVNFALIAIDYKYLNVTLPLTQAILSSYRFPFHSSDLDVLVDNINDKLGGCPFPFYDMEMDSYERSFSASYSATLGRILSTMLSKCSFESQFAYQVNQLLSASKRRDEAPEEDSTVGSWLLAMRRDDYPEDIIEARNELMLEIQNNVLDSVDANDLVRDMEGRDPTEKILGLLAKWLALPVENPTAHKVHAIYPHVKLRYLANNGKYFVPETLADVAFLLNSFLTVNNEVNPSLIQQINEIFQSKTIGWEKILKNFDFSKYSKPRTLVIDVLQLLLDSFELPTCYVITVEIFLKNNVFEGCNPKTESQLQLRAPLTPIIALSHGNLWTHESLGPVKNCTEGSPIKLIDPECLVDIIESKHHARFIIDLLRYHPVPAEMYPYPTRYAIFKAILENLKTEKYKDEVSDFVISQAILRLPLNRKANYPPTFSYLCTEEIAALEMKAPPVQIDVKRQNDMVSPCQNVIDPNSLLEAVNENYDRAKLREILFREPILYEEYKQFGTREEVLKAVVERRKSTTNESETEIALLQAASPTTANGQLPPIVVSSCPAGTPPAEPVLAPCKVQDEYHASVATSTNTNTFSTDTQFYTIQQPTPSGPSDSRNTQINTETLNQNYCSIGETLTAIVDSNSLFRAFSPQAPEAKFIRNKTKSYIIPVVSGFNYTTAEVLRDVLDAIKEDNDNPKVAKNVEILKSFVTDEGPGNEPPGMIYACLPDNPVPEQNFRVGKCSSSTCSSNETVVSVIDPESLFDALGPYAPNSSYVTNTVATYVMPVDPSKNYKKGEVLRSVLEDMLKNGKEELVIKATLASILPNGPSEMSPELVAVCFPTAYLGGSVYSLKPHEICSLHTDSTTEVVAYPTPEIVATAPAGPSLSVSTSAANLAPIQSEHVPVLEVQNQPFAPVQPEPVITVEVQNQPIPPVQPEPVITVEVQNQPIPPVQPEPVITVEVQNQPIPPVQPEPVITAEVQNQPIPPVQPEPVITAEVQNQPIPPVQPEPVITAEVQNQPLSIQQSPEENYYQPVVTEQLITHSPGLSPEPTVVAITQASSSNGNSPTNSIFEHNSLMETEILTTVRPPIASNSPGTQETVVTPNQNLIQDYSQLTTQQQPKIFYIQSESTQPPSYTSTAFHVEPTTGTLVISTINTNDGLTQENPTPQIQNSLMTSMPETSPTADYTTASVDVSSQNLYPTLTTVSVPSFQPMSPYQYINRTSAVSVASSSQDPLPFPFSVMPVWSSSISPNEAPAVSLLPTPQYPFPPIPVWPTIPSIPPMPPFLPSQEYPVIAMAATLQQTVSTPSLPISVLPPVAYLPPVEISSPPTPPSTMAPTAAAIAPSSQETPRPPLPPAVPVGISSPSPPLLPILTPASAAAAAVAASSQETPRPPLPPAVPVGISSPAPSPPPPPPPTQAPVAAAAVAASSQETHQPQLPPAVPVGISSPSPPPPPPPTQAPVAAAAVAASSQETHQPQLPPAIPVGLSSPAPSPPLLPILTPASAAAAASSQETPRPQLPPAIPVGISSPSPPPLPPPTQTPVAAAAIAPSSQETPRPPLPPAVPVGISSPAPSPPLLPILTPASAAAAASSQETHQPQLPPAIPVGISSPSPPLLPILTPASAAAAASSQKTPQPPLPPAVPVGISSPSPPPLPPPTQAPVAAAAVAASSQETPQPQLPPAIPVGISSPSPPPLPPPTQAPVAAAAVAASSQETPQPQLPPAIPVGISSPAPSPPPPPSLSPVSAAAAASSQETPQPQSPQLNPTVTSPLPPSLPLFTPTQAQTEVASSSSQEVPPPSLHNTPAVASASFEQTSQSPSLNYIPPEATTSPQGIVQSPLAPLAPIESSSASPPPPPSTQAPTVTQSLPSSQESPLPTQSTAAPVMLTPDSQGTFSSPVPSLTTQAPSGAAAAAASSQEASSYDSLPLETSPPLSLLSSTQAPAAALPVASQEIPPPTDVPAEAITSGLKVTTPLPQFNAPGSAAASSSEETFPPPTTDVPTTMTELNPGEIPPVQPTNNPPDAAPLGIQETALPPAAPTDVPGTIVPITQETNQQPLSSVTVTTPPTPAIDSSSSSASSSPGNLYIGERPVENSPQVFSPVSSDSENPSANEVNALSADFENPQTDYPTTNLEYPDVSVTEPSNQIASVSGGNADPGQQTSDSESITQGFAQLGEVPTATTPGESNTDESFVPPTSSPVESGDNALGLHRASSAVASAQENSYGSLGGYHREESVRSAEVAKPDIIEETTEIYYATTEIPELANIVLPKIPAEPIGYMHRLENSSFPVYELLKWPIILRPKIGESCYDKKNNLVTSPVVIINITSLFEVLNGTDTSELDEYLTATHLTSLDTYYKLFDFVFENPGNKEEFLKNILGYLLSGEMRPEIREPIKRIISKIPEGVSTPLRFGVLCNQRIYKELPRYRNSSYGLTFTYVTSKPCPSGLLLYNVRASTDAEPPPDLVSHLNQFSEVASRGNLFDNVDWKKIPTQKDLADILIKSLEGTDVILEESKKLISDYLKKEMTTEKWKMKPVVEMGCKEL